MRARNTEHELFARLAPVCKRRETAVLLEGVGRGLLWGAGAAVVLDLLWLAAAVCAWAGRGAGLPTIPAVPSTFPLVVAIVVLAMGPLAGAWLALRRKRDWHAAAVAVDRHYRLHDRTVTAMEFLQKSERKPLEERQIAQCMEHLQGVEAKAVVPLALTGFVLIMVIFVVLGGAAIAVPLAVGPIAGLPDESEPEPPIATQPAREGPARDKPPTAPGVVAEIEWRVAPAGEVKAGRAALAGGLTLEQLVSGLDPSAKPGQIDGEAPRHDAPRRESPMTVLEGEPIPLRHCRTVRRYFRSIRPNERSAREGPAAP